MTEMYNQIYFMRPTLSVKLWALHSCNQIVFVTLSYRLAIKAP